MSQEKPSLGGPFQQNAVSSSELTDWRGVHATRPTVAEFCLSPTVLCKSPILKVRLDRARCAVNGGCALGSQLPWDESATAGRPVTRIGRDSNIDAGRTFGSEDKAHGGNLLAQTQDASAFSPKTISSD